MVNEWVNNKLMKIKDFLKTCYKAADNFVEHDGVEHAGYITFLIIISIFPFILFLIALTGFLGESEAGAIFIKNMLSLMPKEFLPAIIPRIQEIISGPPQSFVAIAFLSLIWTASSFFQGLRNILNRVYRVESPPSYLLRRIGTMVYFLIIALIIAIIIFFSFFGEVIYLKLLLVLKKEISLFASLDFLLVNKVFAFISTTLIVYLSYYTLPDLKKKKFANFLPGTIFVLICWFLVTRAFAIYLESFNQVYVVYGSIAGFVVSMFYLYIVVMIYIFGAEFNYEYAKLKNKKRIVN